MIIPGFTIGFVDLFFAPKSSVSSASVPLGPESFSSFASSFLSILYTCLFRWKMYYCANKNIDSGQKTTYLCNDPKHEINWQESKHGIIIHDYYLKDLFAVIMYTVIWFLNLLALFSFKFNSWLAILNLIWGRQRDSEQYPSQFVWFNTC